MANIKIDDKEFKKKIQEYKSMVLGSRRQQATHDIATEVLRLSQKEVPHDIGTLQNSGFVEDHKDESIVGYNTVYAAALHEGFRIDSKTDKKIYFINYQKGRKRKYLEDPIKNNILKFRKYFERMINT